MEKTNKIIFNALDSKHYVSTEGAKDEYLIFENNYQNALGFDSVSNGFLAVQQGHQPHALAFELPLALALKRGGYAVILLDESGKGKQIDATIDSVLFEMKDMSHTVNYFERLKKNLRETLKKNARTLLFLFKEIFR